MAALHHGADGQAGILSAGPAPQDAGSVLEAERVADNAAVRTGETVRPSRLFQIGRAGSIVRKEPLETRKRFRKREVLSVKNVHGRPPSAPTLDLVGMGVKRIGTEETPERLRDVAGIGPKRAAKITAGWADQKVIREIMVFLHQNGVGTARAVRIFKTYGTDAVQVMSENPYRLAKDIRGIGFRTADTIAEKLGIEKTAMIRVRAGISFALTEAMSDGHCGLPRAELIVLAGKLLEVLAP